jgi:hypothetical protein
MHDLQTDLLSYSHIEADVDRLFKAYLDARLIEFARESKGVPRAYWKAVVEFSRKEFDWSDSAKDSEEDQSIDKMVQAMSDKAVPQGKAGNSDADDEGGELWSYLYWFDVRADYWAPSADGKWADAVAELPPADQLGMVLKEADALSRRILEASNSAKAVANRDGASLAGGTTGVSSGGVPSSLQGFQTLLEKVKSPSGGSSPSHGADEARHRSK